MQFLKRLDSRLADEARRLVAETFISEPYLGIRVACVISTAASPSPICLYEGMTHCRFWSR